MANDTDQHTSGATLSSRPTKERHLALLGGWRRGGSAPAPDRALAVAVIGGAVIDLSDAAIPRDGTTITQISVIGGLDLTVPAGTRVEVTGFSVLGGRRTDLGDPAPDARVVRVRSFALIGGARIHA